MINAIRPSILHILSICIGQGENTYTQVSINKMLELLTLFYDVHVARRWLFQCLRELEDDGYICRQRRYLRLAGGLVRSIPSSWSLTPKGFKWLALIGDEMGSI